MADGRFGRPTGVGVDVERGVGAGGADGGHPLGVAPVGRAQLQLDDRPADQLGRLLGHNLRLVDAQRERGRQRARRGQAQQGVERQPGVAAEAVVERQVERGAGRGRAGGDDRVGGQPGGDVGRVVGEGVGTAGSGGPDSGQAVVADAVVGRDGAFAPALVAGQPQPVGAAALASAIADAEGGAEMEGDRFPGETGHRRDYPQIGSIGQIKRSVHRLHRLHRFISLICEICVICGSIS